MAVTAADDSHWLAFRTQLGLEPGATQFNTGTTGVVPLPVRRAASALRERQASAPPDFLWRELPVRLDHARARLAAYLHADRRGLLLLQNITVAMNLAVRGLEWPAGSEIVATDHEYGAMLMLLRQTCKERGWTLRLAAVPMPPESPEQVVEALLGACGPCTKALFFSHVSSPTGLAFPAAALCRAARERGLATLIDGAHAPGMLPLDLAALDADFYAGNCHKWLQAPLGAAFLAVRAERRAALTPLIVSWGWEHDPAKLDEDSGWGGSFWHRNLEFHGTIDRIAQCVLPETLDFRAALGDAAARDRQFRNAAECRERLAACGLAPRSAADPALRSALEVFAIPAVDPVKARDYLWRRWRAEAPATCGAGQWFWRISNAWFNHAADYDRLAEIAPQIPWAELA